MGLYEWDVLWAYMNGTSYGPNMNALPDSRVQSRFDDGERMRTVQ